VLAGRFVVPEIYQDEATPEVLSQALLNAVDDKHVRLRQAQVFQAIHEQLRQDTRERIAEALVPLLTRSGRAPASHEGMAGAEVGRA
jgi:lipid-A-disaccharide synthase